MFEVDISSKKPLYQQIVDNTKDLLGKNILRENDKMPSVRELANILKVNISTVQKAYQILEKDKIINTIIGKGTFITNNLDDIKPNYALIDSLIEDLIREARLLGISKKELLQKIEYLFSGE